MTLSPQFLEAVNGALLIIFLSVLLVFGRYIFIAVRHFGWSEGRRQRVAALAVFILVFGDCVIRSSVWLWRHLENHHIDTRPYLDAITISTTVGAVICIVGGICILRHFAPKSWGPWPWIVAPIVSVAFGIGMAL